MTTPDQSLPITGARPRKRRKPGLRTRRWSAILGTSLFFGLAGMMGVSSAHKLSVPQNTPVQSVSYEDHEENERYEENEEHEQEDEDEDEENEEHEYSRQNQNTTPVQNWSASPPKTVPHTTVAKSHGS